MKSIQDLMNRSSDLALASAKRTGIEVVTETRSCDEHGEYQARGFSGRKIWSGCPACREINEAKQKAIRDAEAIDRAEKRILAQLEESGIPHRFMDRVLGNYLRNNKGQQRAYDFAHKFANEFDDVVKTGRSAVFIGKPGTGKTHLACAISQHIARNHNASFRFVTVLRAMRSIKDSWSKESELTEGQAINEFVYPDLLILDEVGVQFGSEFEKNILFDVLNQRYEKRKPTIFMSNLPLPELAAYLGERVMDRLREDGGAVIPFDWESQRGKVAQ